MYMVGNTIESKSITMGHDPLPLYVMQGPIEYFEDSVGSHDDPIIKKIIESSTLTTEVVKGYARATASSDTSSCSTC